MARLVEYLPGTHETLGLVPHTAKNYVVAHSYNLSAQELETRESEVQVHYPLCSKFEVSLG